MLRTAILLLAAVTAFAHHSMTMYDFAKTREYRGIVTRFENSNPHINIWLDVEQNGKTVHFKAEGGNPQALRKLGWTPGVLKPGEKIRIRFYVMKDGTTDAGWVISVTKEDGTVLGVKSPDDEPR